jgi:hypothetical protein
VKRELTAWVLGIYYVWVFTLVCNVLGQRMVHGAYGKTDGWTDEHTLSCYAFAGIGGWGRRAASRAQGGGEQPSQAQRVGASGGGHPVAEESGVDGAALSLYDYIP